MFKKVQTKKVYMEIVEQIQNLIKEGKLKLGDKLPPERILAEKLGVSRPPLREAISALEILGIIESRGGKGNFIKNTFNPASYAQRLKELEREESPFELLEARKAVETEIAGLAAEKATPEDIKEIEEALDKMREALSDTPRAMEFDRRFHVAIAKAAHNSILFQMMNDLADGLKESLWVNIKEKSWALPGHPQKYLEEHTKLLEAIKKGDKETACRTMHIHLADVKEDLLEE
ncbi:MAG: FadR/GntR family transcriptional regulator [Candidatus Aerophobetes bacterium]|nr:FadR/GntR family transcriptional regulator [Candidatus Aerophobetes bacterium]